MRVALYKRSQARFWHTYRKTLKKKCCFCCRVMLTGRKNDVVVVVTTEKRKEITHFHFHYAWQKLTCVLSEWVSGMVKYISALTHGIMLDMYHRNKGNGWCEKNFNMLDLWWWWWKAKVFLSFFFCSASLTQFSSLFTRLIIVCDTHTHTKYYGNQ